MGINFSLVLGTIFLYVFENQFKTDWRSVPQTLLLSYYCHITKEKVAWFRIRLRPISPILFLNS